MKTKNNNIRMDVFRSRRYGNSEKEIVIFFKDYPDAADGFAGYVTGSGLPHEAVLCMDPRPKEKQSYDYACVVKNNQHQKAVVFMEDTIFQGLKNNNTPELFILFHELGHYVYHPSAKEPAEAARYDMERQNAIAAGTVIEDERMADEIAAGYLGYNAAIEGLNWLLMDGEKRASTGLYDLESAEISMKEIRLRIQILREKAGCQ